MTQSLSVWRSMPAHFAASARLMPSSALAIPNRRREMRASGSDLASLRSTVDVRSLRIFSFAIARLLGRIAPTMESELNAAGNRRTATRVELYARRYDIDAPGGIGQSAVLRGIGRKFVHSEREALGRHCIQHHART